MPAESNKAGISWGNFTNLRPLDDRSRHLADHVVKDGLHGESGDDARHLGLTELVQCGRAEACSP